MDGDASTITLADSLLTEAGWERTWFGYDGPFPPYARIGMRWIPGSLSFEPCFECWKKDRIFRRSKTSMRDHMRRYAAVRFLAPAVEDRYGAQVVREGRFPIGEWLQIWRVQFGAIEVTDNAWGLKEVDPLLLVTAGSVELLRRPPPDPALRRDASLWEHFDKTQSEFDRSAPSNSPPT